MSGAATGGGVGADELLDALAADAEEDSHDADDSRQFEGKITER